MTELIRAHQLDIMLFLCGACGMLILLLLMTRSITKRRKRDILLMEIMALLLLWSDRLAYIYAGDPSVMGYFMVRISNFMVFFLTPGIAFGFYRYLSGVLTTEGKVSSLPARMKAVGVISVFGMLLAVVSAFTGLYYYFDENNLYHRGRGFLIAYIIPVVAPFIMYTVAIQYRKLFSRQMFITLTMYLFVPVICGVIQIFTYGISIVNMAMVAVSLSLYISTYVDINYAVERAHRLEIWNMKDEQRRMQKLFDQTATAFVSAVENRDDFMKGRAVRTASYAKRIAELSGKSDEDCQKVYYAALLHDVGMIGIPDAVIKNGNDPSGPDREIIMKKPVIGREILSSITEYPYLAQAAYYSHERYNGSGYPEGLKGTDIPEIARIVAVADAYVIMTTKKRYRDARPDLVAREAFVKGSGEKFDPVFADIMVRIIDSDKKTASEEDAASAGTGLSCGEYRDSISDGINVDNNVRRISFECVPNKKSDDEFSSPSIILYDSFDNRVHNDEKSIKENHYYEYGELWFDEHMISTGIRKSEIRRLDRKENPAGGTGYEIIAAKFEDHVRLVMSSPALEKEVIIALPDSSRSVYIGLTGEHCEIKGINITMTGETVSDGDIPCIAEAVSYTDHLESDIGNIQADRTRSASTEGIEIDGRFRLAFHTMSLPGANLIWHCPYIVLFSSDNGMVGGENYREYALIKLNGENEEVSRNSQNKFTVRRNDDFPGWDVWLEKNKEGMECEVSFERKNGYVIVKTENLGIELDCITETDPSVKVYAALTGDQVALTDIRFL
ncbi:MAG: HD domain-containing protein [Oscillospiraceae bacterium]|nr:HD domain-containing protein [Oscillospiraceae bacterium]